MTYKTIDLCAGIGGIRKGFELAGGFRNVASAEIDEIACRTYEHLFGENPHNDITDDAFKSKLQHTEYDVLMAGFPCQAFSSVGLRQGFEDKTKGTVFFDIAKIIQMTQPKVVFLENVQNLLSHDKKATFWTIIDTLERQLNYHVVGINHDEAENLQYTQSAFIRNSKDFGVPQNRPRVYIVAFNKLYFGEHLKLIPNETPKKRSREPIYDSLESVLEKDVPARYFLSGGYLETLEKHCVKQRSKGYGFGYCVINQTGREHPIANTLLATGGSGKERNLVYDPINGKKYSGQQLYGKKSPLNVKSIRMTTPTEWGRLQGFIGYGFMKENGEDTFSFPEDVSIVQQYKQLGNSVTIPVIEEMALFIKNSLITMEAAFSPEEKTLYGLYGNEFLICHRIMNRLGKTLRKSSILSVFDVVHHFESRSFRVKELAEYLGVTSSRASQLLGQLLQNKCVVKNNQNEYSFANRLLQND